MTSPSLTIARPSFRSSTSGLHPCRWMLLALALLAVLSLATVYRPLDFYPLDSADGAYYRAIAYNWFGMSRPELDVAPPTSLWRTFRPTSAISLHLTGPFAYRVGAPLLARLIGLPLGDHAEAGFYLLNLVSLVAAAYWLGLAAWRLTQQVAAGAATVLLFVLTPALVSRYLWDYILIDPPAYALLSAAVLCLALGRRRLFLAICLVAPFVREALVVVPACLLIADLLTRLWEPRRWIAPALTLVPYLAFHLWLPILNPSQSGWVLVADGAFPARAASVFGLLWLLALPAAIRSRFLWSLLPMVVIALGGALFVADVERATSYAFPFVLLGAVTTLSDGWAQLHARLTPIPTSRPR